MTLFLVRHGDNDLVGHTLAGRKPAVELNALGREQAVQLGEQLSGCGITSIFASPQPRAVQTAEPLAHRLRLLVNVEPAFNEIDFGDWTGHVFAELETDERWRQWNSYRLGIRPPNGEMMVEVQTRFVLKIENLRAAMPNACIAVFSHADPIKSVLMYYLGMPLDHFQRLDIATASFSILNLGDWGARLAGFNLGTL
jgi:broad specificity phosphatase PhoE